MTDRVVLPGHPPGAGWPPRARLETFAHDWSEAIAGTSYVAMDAAEVHEQLTAHTEHLVRALLDEPFTAGPAYGVGVALIAAHFTGAQTLSRTIAVLPELLSHLGIDSPELRSRLGGLQGELAAGYAQALRERTLDEQESLLRAALTAREHARHELRASEARFGAVFAGAAIAIAVGDLQGRIVEANESLATMLGWSVAELRGRMVAEFVHPDDAGDTFRILDGLLRGRTDRAQTEQRFRRRNGGVIWADLALSLVRDDDGKPSYLVAMGQDVTDRHKLQMRLQHEALHDPLTRLPNRALFTARLAQVFAQAGPGTRVGLCLLDLDGFKTVNDRFGHDTGDQLLVAVSDRLDRVSREGRFLARLGGDEFAVLLTQPAAPAPAPAGLDDLTAVATTALTALAPPIRLGRRELTVTASIGVAERSPRVDDPVELLRAADVALYWAKGDGGNAWARFDPDREVLLAD